ncbi:MAG: hypothetical protein VYD08_10260 [Pseudomonadota bacterium]|nr:hypothetical protein [Pseudomonadota bacterium]
MMRTYGFQYATSGEPQDSHFISLDEYYSSVGSDYSTTLNIKSSTLPYRAFRVKSLQGKLCVDALSPGVTITLKDNSSETLPQNEVIQYNIDDVASISYGSHVFNIVPPIEITLPDIVSPAKPKPTQDDVPFLKKLGITLITVLAIILNYGSHSWLYAAFPLLLGGSTLMVWLASPRTATRAFNSAFTFGVAFLLAPFFSLLSIIDENWVSVFIIMAITFFMPMLLAVVFYPNYERKSSLLVSSALKVLPLMFFMSTILDAGVVPQNTLSSLLLEQSRENIIWHSAFSNIDN